MLEMIFTAILIQHKPDHEITNPNHWYDYACCHSRHCRPALPGEVKRDLRGGWLTHNQFIQWGSKADRKSKDPEDRRFHVCIDEEGIVLCVYSPEANG